ncbi:hypothetical protein E4198_00145 [Streptomyces sp. RKND-216]|uniref:DUF6197 family protein n=1 Tax=Streptomyces sp. RKND-216 TaxID=2562581 RepID=UPI00109DE4D6|nr:hypothetical protein [Streptomyces sp. RKND-216]THA28259.1 hypothetical protein E4198_00145 [Streptomyces sp. RKND-216]
MTAMTTTLAPAVPRTFRSEKALATAVDAVFADALAQELADALADDAPGTGRPFGLPTTGVLIAQAGIATGPAAPDPRSPSPAVQAVRRGAAVGGRWAGRAAWWLLKTAACATAVLTREALAIGWQMVFGTALPGTARPAELEAVPRPTASAFLKATSDRLQVAGWSQHALHTATGSCVLGAERDLIADGAGTRRTATRANGHLCAVTGAWSVSAWNDALARREDQVHAALLAAAARARAAGD